MIGTKLAQYQITNHLGTGGMGEVYQALDTKLGRGVAIKLLPEAFTHDNDWVARFKREARVLASLNHPNIAAIYGVEESAGRKFLVMELVPGETLAERMKSGPIPVEETLGIAKQIAEGLEAAHEKGIIHRDLKPANIKLTPDGQVKVLDFGLAKAFQDQPQASLSNSPTLMSASMPGVILGTAAYMSPEQAKGKEADRTSDVWSFGCVFYEMLTGRAVFGGETVGEILAEIFKSGPEWDRLPADTPEGIRRLLRRCLQKDRKERLQHAGDARIEIDEIRSGAPTNSGIAQSASRRRERIAWVSTVAVLSLVAVAATVLALLPSPAIPEVRLDIATPPTTDPAALAISPDGQKVVFAATSEGVAQLWIRSLDSPPARALPATEGATYPFWSPDSRSIGFFAGSKLKRIDIDGGSLQVLANAGLGIGGAWSPDGTILFSPAAGGGPIFRISATGGERAALTQLGTEQVSHRFPQFLPDGRRFLYFVTGGAATRGVYVGQIDGSQPRRLFDADAAAVYASSGQLLFVRRGTLFAQNFDPLRLTLSGDPFPVSEGVVAGALSASAAGPIVYRTGSTTRQRQFVWFDRSGKEIGKVGGPDDAAPRDPSISPDGRRVALRRIVNGNSNIWLLEIARGVLSRFTFDAGADSFPIWSPDGNRIAFSSTRGSVARQEPGSLSDLYEKPATGAEMEKLLLATPPIENPSDWSPDGRFLLYRRTPPNMSIDIWALPMEGDRKPFPVIQTNFDERDGQFSPDGKWIAYQSDESGRFEIYVQPFPGPGSKFQISPNGGAQVRWRRDGKELFYIALNGQLMAVPIAFSNNGQAVEPGAPSALFATRVGGAVQGVSTQQYVVSPDGQRFLMNTDTDEATSPITLLLNWKPRSK